MATKDLGLILKVSAKVAAAVVLGAMPAGVTASGVAPGGPTAPPYIWSFAEVFTFLFVVLGPLNVIGPFVAMTKGQDAAFRQQAAIKSFAVSVVGVMLVAGIGSATLKAWGISLGAILATGGAILVLVALRTVLAGYTQADHPPQPSRPPASAAELAFSPLAFPTIVTPYGLDLLILLFALYPVSSGGLWVLATALLVLMLDLLAMLCAGRIAKIPLMEPALNILGCVMNVLLIALGVQAVADGLRIIAPPTF
jgi:multiple antibiotic resistance protein